MTSVSFEVLGIPAPQGSKQAFVVKNRAVVVEGGTAVGRKKHKAWRDNVAWCAQQALHERGSQFPGLVSVTVTFRMPMPASDPYRTYHGTAPDIDKIVRSVLDALTASGLIVDDARVCDLHASKSYDRSGYGTGCSVTVVDVSDEESSLRDELKATTAMKRKKRS